MVFCWALTMPASPRPAERVIASTVAVFFIRVIIASLPDLSYWDRSWCRRRSVLPQQYAQADDQAGHVSIADVAPDDPFDDGLDQARKHQQQSRYKKQAAFA